LEQWMKKKIYDVYYTWYKFCVLVTNNSTLF
jgi:hypothetical protein